MENATDIAILMNAVVFVLRGAAGGMSTPQQDYKAMFPILCGISSAAFLANSRFFHWGDIVRMKPLTKISEIYEPKYVIYIIPSK
jgi:hypothetical protein